MTHTESEALMLEYNLIKHHKPRFNVVLRDDKSYPYIRVRTDQTFPQVTFYRGSRRAAGRLFGPYPSAGSVRETLNQLQKLFRVRHCEDSYFSHRSRPCLQYQIQRCTAPCVDLVSAQDYQRDVEHAMMFLQGRSEAITEVLVQRMENASRQLDFERAAQYRDQLAKLKSVESQQLLTRSRGDIDAIGLVCGSRRFLRGRVVFSRWTDVGVPQPLPASTGADAAGGGHARMSAPILWREKTSARDPDQPSGGRCARTRRDADGAGRAARVDQAPGSRRPRGVDRNGARQPPPRQRR